MSTMMKLMTVAALGAVAGAAAALAFSPETRDKLKDRFDSAKDDATDLYEKGKKAVSHVAQTAKEEYNDWMEEGKKTATNQANKTKEDLKTV